ncbi:MAG TPA: hypothetical protein EYQ44_02275 [Porticoccaceae bacterium]|nr:hypothetical protein [Porticoccaceae bacterium]HIK81061.1 hypothetical protein [Porticoccaceae bacterium]
MDALLFRTPVHAALLGIDISSSAVKLVELHVNQERHFEVVTYAVVPLPEGAVRDHEIADERAIANAINEVLKKSVSRYDNGVGY